MNSVKTSRISVQILQILFILYMDVLHPQTAIAPGDTVAGKKLITAVAESEEFRWTGTASGLIRTSKKSGRQKTYTTSNSALPSNLITSICCRKNGHVWIGTPEGVVVNDRYCFFRLYTENSRIPDNLIRFIVEDADEVVWICTRTGLVKVRHNRFFLFDLQVKRVDKDITGGHCFVTASDVSVSSGSLK